MFWITWIYEEKKGQKVGVTEITNGEIREGKMPTVGQKKFAYTAAGKKAAKKYAKKSGKKVKKAKGY